MWWVELLNSIVAVLDSGGAGGGGGSYESIATVTGDGTSTSLTFTSIPSTYASLQIRGFGRNTSGYIRFNSDTGTNYARHQLRGNGTTATAAGAATVDSMFAFHIPDNSDPANMYGVGIVDIHNYASTTQNKTLRSFTGYDLNGSGSVYLFSGLWMNTNAITSITIYSPSNAPTTSSTFSLYGIKGA